MTAKATLKVELINVGHGDALLLHWTAEGGIASTVLIDGGPQAGGQRVKDSLGRLGATAIDLAVLTHCDADHVDGLLAYASAEVLPIRRYWGPCLPAFRRHGWLFPPRVQRGLDQAEALQAALGRDCAISWPVEGAAWSSPDGGLSITVLSPPGRLIERLLIGDDSLSLFLEQPTPLGWLLSESKDAPPIEDPFADLRFAISTGEITLDRIPAAIPPTSRSSSPTELAREAAERGIDPEFFGNSVLNDSSIVLLVEARLGVARRRLLFTGDLENFTYLVARHPMGLGCEVVKAPHHGSHSFVDRETAYDEVWQWLRPRAALVSANGKHRLPRSAFRDAALRYGTTLFCTSRRGREIVSGKANEACCHIQFACHKRAQAPVSLSITEAGIDADDVACARGNLHGVMPVIEVRQHVVEPSPILTTLAENEIRKHTEWAVTWLRGTLEERRGRPSRPDLEPISLEVMQQAAVAAQRHAAAAEMETLLERAAREGKVWLSRRSGYRRNDRQTWVMPNSKDTADLKAWIDRFLVIQLALPDPRAASALEEVLFASDTTWLADRLAETLLFPRAMFGDILWPILVAHLLKTRFIGIRTLPDELASKYGAATIIALSKSAATTRVVASLNRWLQEAGDDDELRSFLEDSAESITGYGQPALKWPAALNELVSPLWLGRVLPPNGLMFGRWDKPIRPFGNFHSQDRTAIEEWIGAAQTTYNRSPLAAELVPAALSAVLLSGFDIVSRPKRHR